MKETCEVGLSDAVERVALGARSPSLADWLAARTGWSRKRLETVLASPLEAERRAARFQTVAPLSPADSDFLRKRVTMTKRANWA